MEPKSNPDSGLSACLSKSFIKLFFAKGYGRAGGICLCWNDFIINLTIIAHNIISIHCEVTEKCSNKQFFYSLVFMLTLKKSLQSQLWNELVSLFSSNNYEQPWLLIGDFNNIINLEEKVGGDRSVS